MKVTVEQIAPERAEEVLLRCHDPKEPWVEEIQSIAAGQITVNGMADGKLCRLKLGDIYYFEVVDGNAFFYCQKEVFSSKQKLYEFEALCVGTMLFRCSKSMIREHTVLEDFPLFCPKCRYTCVIRFKDGKMEETVPEKA